jgi:hypothetical protein
MFEFRWHAVVRREGATEPFEHLNCSRVGHHELRGGPAPARDGRVE